LRSVGKMQPAGQRQPVTTDVGGRRFSLVSPVTALVIGGVTLALAIADVPLAALAHQSLNASGGSVPVWFSAAFAIVGLVVAWRKPRNPIGWILLGIAAFGTLSQDGSYYAVADYRLRQGSLPFGWVAMLAQLCWAPAITLGGLAFLLFPDGSLPSPRWRWVLWIYLTWAALFTGGALALTIGAAAGHDIHVGAGGDLLILDHPASSEAWWGVVSNVFPPWLIVTLLAALTRQVLSYRHSSAERRQQLKWLLSGSAIGGVCIIVTFQLSDSSSGIVRMLGAITLVGGLALPLSMGVAILKYRLYDIDRIISRTLAYAILTALLVAVYAGLVLLATQVPAITSPVAVAAATLAAAALFNPLRRRVQRAVDRRFNRARFDADATAAAFAARLKGAVDLNTVRDDLTHVVQNALEPAHISVWVSQRE
jgi:hypothetical protein